LTVAERLGDKARRLAALAKVQLLIIDDWFLAAPTAEQARNLHTLVDRRSGAASTVFCTQLPPDQWHKRMEEEIVADAIIDRIVNNAHITLLDCGESMRKHFNRMEP
jgi:DNA replication protein DnaC